MTAADRSPVSTTLYESCALLATNHPSHPSPLCLGTLWGFLFLAIYLWPVWEPQWLPFPQRVVRWTQGWLLKDLGVEMGTPGSFLSALRSASSLQDGTQVTGMDLKTRISDSTLRFASRSLKRRHHCVFGGH